MTTDLPTPLHTIEALCERSHAISLEKGWVTAEGDPRSFATITNLNHSELSEALEEWRAYKPLSEIWYEVTIEADGQNGNPATTHKETWSLDDKQKYDSGERQFNATSGCKVIAAKPCGISIELADFIIRVCQHSGTAKKGKELSDIYDTRSEQPAYNGLDELLAEVHLSVSLSYNAKKNNEEGEVLEHLADALVEVFTFCAANGIDLWAAIDEKEAFNRTRSHKHGGKKA